MVRQPWKRHRLEIHLASLERARRQESANSEYASANAEEIATARDTPNVVTTVVVVCVCFHTVTEDMVDGDLGLYCG